MGGGRKAIFFNENAPERQTKKFAMGGGQEAHFREGKCTENRAFSLKNTPVFKGPKNSAWSSFGCGQSETPLRQLLAGQGNIS